MKSCSECGKAYPISRVLCLDCCEILEERPYLRLVLLTLAIAVLAHFTLAKFGYAGHGLVKESFMSEVFLLIPCVVAWKCVQKLKTPQRRILYEIGSLYSDRFGRAMIIAATIFSLLLFSGAITFKPAGIGALNEPPALAYFRTIRYYTILSGGLIFLLLVFYIQKLNLFDFRLKNSLIQQELRNSGSG